MNRSDFLKRASSSGAGIYPYYDIIETTFYFSEIFTPVAILLNKTSAHTRSILTATLRKAANRKISGFLLF
ncbi:MAG: hypothetical protein RPR97_10715, partial [Colwellia sp.]